MDNKEITVFQKHSLMNSCELWLKEWTYTEKINVQQLYT